MKARMLLFQRSPMDRKFFDLEDRTIIIEDEFGRNSTPIRREYVKDIPNQRARIAMELVARWGMVAATDGGEDAAGRSKLKLQSPVEIVDRAMKTADILISSIENSGWFIPCPDPRDYYEDDAPDA